MLTRIDHLVIAVTDPDAAADELESAVGLRSTGGGRHEHLGTFNRLVWLGDTYVELAGVWDVELAKASMIGPPTLATLRIGGGLATYAVGTDDLVSDLADARSLGANWAGPSSGERMRPDGRVVRWRQAAPPHLSVDDPPFMIEHDPTAAEWTPEERAARATETHPLGGPVRLEVLEIPVAEVRRVANGYTRALGLRFRPSIAGRGARDASIGSQIVRLRSGTGPAVVRLAAPGVEPRSVMSLGVTWIVRSS
ncbi:MAG TPA: VOC family protein [Candidatus Limnocylindrales bacterium]|nr:VOC family protein [Candidatus Limnocylindrales bacterium]